MFCRRHLPFTNIEKIMNAKINNSARKIPFVHIKHFASLILSRNTHIRIKKHWTTSRNIQIGHLRSHKSKTMTFQQKMKNILKTEGEEKTSVEFQGRIIKLVLLRRDIENFVDICLYFNFWLLFSFFSLQYSNS